MTTPKDIPEVCQATGQITCTSLTDVTLYPTNTNVEFTNVFDNTVDFARVDNVALSKIWFTTSPPGPLPVVLDVAFIGSLDATIQSKNSSTQLAVVGDSEIFSNTGAAVEPFGLRKTITFAPPPQFGIGLQLPDSESIQELGLQYQGFYNNPENLSFTVTDAGSFGDSLSSPVVAGTTTTSHMSYWDPSIPGPIPAFGHPRQKSYRTGVYNMIDGHVVKPNVHWGTNITNSVIGAPLALNHGRYTYAVLATDISEDEPLYDPASLSGQLVANMSDGSTILLGTLVFELNPQEFNPPTPEMAEYLASIKCRIVCPLPWPIVDLEGPDPSQFAIIYRGTSEPPVGGPPLTSVGNQIDAIVTDIIDYNIVAPDSFFEPVVPTTFSSRAVVQKLTPAALLLRKRAPVRYCTAYIKKRFNSLSIPRSLSATPTVDNVLQIICNELEVDRTAGSQSSQLLAVVPFNYALLASGFYEIPIETNSLVWRRLADIHIRSITFGLFNGIGDPHPALAGQEFVTNLQLRYL
jgi:hypothetical protein